MENFKIIDNCKYYRFLPIIFFIFLFLGTLRAQNQIATLSDGQEVILYSNKTWDYFNRISYDFDFSTIADNKIPSFLRQGIFVDRQTLIVAVEIYLQGWRYTMPRPKSPQASWDNYDGRTTWWKGYWYNINTLKYSRQTPLKQKNGYYCGDEQNDKDVWSNGGSPGYPSQIDWLLSSNGGVNPD